MDCMYHYDSPLGGITMTGDGRVLTGLYFDGQRDAAAALSAARPDRNLPVFDETVRWLDIYFSGKAPGFTPAMRLTGTAFQHAVWDILLTIPYGQTMTYGQVAERLAGWTGSVAGRPQSFIRVETMPSRSAAKPTAQRAAAVRKYMLSVLKPMKCMFVVSK